MRLNSIGVLVFLFLLWPRSVHAKLDGHDSSTSRSMWSELRWQTTKQETIIELTLFNGTDTDFFFCPNFIVFNDMSGRSLGFSKHYGIGSILSCFWSGGDSESLSLSFLPSQHRNTPSVDVFNLLTVQVYLVKSITNRTFVFKCECMLREENRVSNLQCDTSFIRIWPKESIISRLALDKNYSSDEGSVHLSIEQKNDGLLEWIDKSKSGYVMPHTKDLYLHLQSEKENVILLPDDVVFVPTRE